MINFPKIGHVREPVPRKMTSEEYLAFCDFCIRNNSRITPENCMERKTGEEDIRKPFRM